MRHPLLMRDPYRYEGKDWGGTRGIAHTQGFTGVWTIPKDGIRREECDGIES